MIAIPEGTEVYEILDHSMRNKKERRLLKAKVQLMTLTSKRYLILTAPYAIEVFSK